MEMPFANIYLYYLAVIYIQIRISFINNFFFSVINSMHCLCDYNIILTLKDTAFFFDRVKEVFRMKLNDYAIRL